MNAEPSAPGDIEEIVIALNYSSGIADRFLNDGPGIHLKTRRQVLKASVKFGYGRITAAWSDQ